MVRKKKRPSKGVEALDDGRFKIDATRVNPRTSERQFRVKTLPHGTTLGEAIDARAALALSLKQGGRNQQERKQVPSLGAYTQSWIARRTRRVRKVTARSYAYKLERYVLPHLGDLPLDDLRRADLEDWLVWLEQDSPLGLRAQRTVWGIALAVIRDGCADWNLSDPSQRLAGPRGRLTEAGRALSAKELGQVVAAALEMRPDKCAVVVTLAYTGMRRTGARRQRRDDLDLSGGWLVVSHSKTSAGAGRRIPLPPVAVGAIERWLAMAPESPFIWSHPEDRSRPASRQWVYEAVKKAAKIAGIECTPHDLRRTYTTLLWRAGVDELVRRSILGHADPKTHAGYVRVSDEDARRVLRVMK